MFPKFGTNSYQDRMSSNSAFYSTENGSNKCPIDRVCCNSMFCILFMKIYGHEVKSQSSLNKTHIWVMKDFCIV